MTRKMHKALGISLFYLVILSLALVTLLPFLWMISSSFKTGESIRTIPIQWIPKYPSLDGYRQVFNMQSFSFVRSSFNSLFLAVMSTVVEIMSASMAAFAFSKIPFRGSGRLFGLYLATMMIPGAVTMVPTYVILRIMGLLDTFTGLILPALAKVFSVFLMRQAMKTLNDSYLESAMLDGASLYRVFFVVVLPMVTPTLATLVLLAFMGNWNTYLWPLIVLTSNDKLTLQLVLGKMNGLYRTKENVLMAGAVLTILPILLVYLLTQRKVDNGIALGGLK